MKKQIDKFLKDIVEQKLKESTLEFNKRVLPCEIEDYLKYLGFEIEYVGENGWQHDSWKRCKHKKSGFELTLYTDRYYGNRELTYDIEATMNRLNLQNEEDKKLADELDGLINGLAKHLKKDNN